MDSGPLDPTVRVHTYDNLLNKDRTCWIYVIRNHILVPFDHFIQKVELRGLFKKLTKSIFHSSVNRYCKFDSSGYIEWSESSESNKSYKGKQCKLIVLAIRVLYFSFECEICYMQLFMIFPELVVDILPEGESEYHSQLGIKSKSRTLWRDSAAVSLAYISPINFYRSLH